MIAAMPRLSSPALAALLCALASAATARAQTNAESVAAAEALFTEGKRLMADGQAPLACPKFEESQRLDPGLGTLLNLAACYEAVGRVASAWSMFLAAESQARSDENKQGIRVAQKRAAALAPKLSRLVVTVEKPDAVPELEVRRDDVVVGRGQWGTPIPVDPGVHTVVATAPGRLPFRARVNVAKAGATMGIRVPELEMAPAEPVQQPRGARPAATHETKQHSDSSQPSTGLGTQRVLAIGAGVIGLGGVAVGTIFGLKSMSEKEEAERYCDDRACPDDAGVEHGKDAREAGNIATIGFISGGVGLVGGAVLWLTAKDAPDTGRSTQLRFRLGHVAFEGRF
jgi:hypothetical protein